MAWSLSLRFLFCLSMQSFVVVGGYYRSNFGLPSSAFTIDCRFHKVESIPDIPKDMSHMVAEIIDGNIYVIGQYESQIMVFDTKTQTWELGVTNPEFDQMIFLWSGGVVMADKIYFRDCENSFVYSVKESKCETDSMLNSKKWRFACVHDDILYYYDNLKNKLRRYDTKHKRWRVVKGLRRLFPYQPIPPWWSSVVSYGEKLVVFLSDLGTETRYAGIALERRQRREIGDNVEWCQVVTGGKSVVMNYVSL